MSTRLQVRCDAQAGVLRLCVDMRCAEPWTVLFGASGSGKTSLLRLIAGLWRPAGSTVVLDAVDLSKTPAHRRRAVLVAQHPAPFPNLSVRANVAFGARGDAATVDRMMERFGLDSLAQQPIGRLSGGEAQRVCLARAMATSPSLLLLDESFTGLHRMLRDELLAVLRDLQIESGMKIVSVTHDVSEAFTCADEVLRVNEGRIVAVGPAAEVLAAEREELLRRLDGTAHA